VLFPTVTVEAGGCRQQGGGEPLPKAVLPANMQRFAESYDSAAVRTCYQGTPFLLARVTLDC